MDIENTEMLLGRPNVVGIGYATDDEVRTDVTEPRIPSKFLKSFDVKSMTNFLVGQQR